MNLSSSLLALFAAVLGLLIVFWIKSPLGAVFAVAALVWFVYARVVDQRGSKIRKEAFKSRDTSR